MAESPEPTIVCDYWQTELPKVFSDIALLMQGLMLGGVLRLGTEWPDAMWAVPKWCLATGNRVIGSSQMCIYPLGLEYIFDIERGSGNVYSTSLS